jgi:hypothetical protein
VYRDFGGERNPLASRWICKGPNVPGDFALVREGFDAKCPKSNRPNDETNAWFIRKPGPGEIVCKGFLMWHGSEIEGAAIPTGYVVVGQLVAKPCASSNHPKDPTNAWSVRLPRQHETVCKGFLIPRGYVVTGETTASACPPKTIEKNAWLIMPRSYIETRRVWPVP